jgi:chromosome partitioning protein
MRIISVATQKGGCGKTTTAINLGASLSANGKRTLLIDLDPQAHASLGLNFENKDSIYNVISKLTPRKMTITDIIRNVGPNFDIVPSNILVGTLEQELADEIGRELKLTDIVVKLKDNYDYILIDCPPSLGFLTVNALRASDEVFIPVETSRFSMQGVEHLLDIVSLIRERLGHPIEHRILVTMFDSRLRHSFSMLSQIREKFSDVLFDTIIHTNVKLKESVVMGQTVVDYDKYCRGAKDYFSMAKEIISKYEIKAAQAQASQAPAKAIDTKVAPPRQVVAPAAQIPAELPIAEPAAASEIKVEENFRFSNRMQSLMAEGMNGMRMTTFSLDAPEARSVYVTGSFNDWSLDEKCRMRLEGGRWLVDVGLRPGVHKYQFIVDGRWREDPANPRQERNSFGDINSLVEVQNNGNV